MKRYRLFCYCYMGSLWKKTFFTTRVVGASQSLVFQTILMFIVVADPSVVMASRACHAYKDAWNDFLFHWSCLEHCQLLYHQLQTYPLKSVNFQVLCTVSSGFLVFLQVCKVCVHNLCTAHITLSRVFMCPKSFQIVVG